jgi:glutathione synthase/RimK-type ligase-like ATP-grasp enzyme
MGNPWAYDLTAIGARTAPVLIVLGSDADPAAKKQGGGYRVLGNSDIFKLLPDSFAFEQINLSKPFLRQQGRPDLSRFDCVLNLVTDPDQHPQTLATLGKLLRGYKGRIVNRPEAVLRTTRDQVAKRLEGVAGLRVPKVLRLRNPKPGAASTAAQRAGLAFPLIVRMAGTHTGTIIGIVNSPDELDAATAGPGAFILTEFVDFRSDDGLYRKHRVFFIGRRRIYRHLIGNDGWSIHAKERFHFMTGHPGLIAEEQRIVEDPAGLLPGPVSAALDAVRERLGLDYFGVDFGIAPDGRAVLFEANATMNFFPVVDLPPFAHIRCVIKPARQALLELLGPAPPAGMRPIAAAR